MFTPRGEHSLLRSVDDHGEAWHLEPILRPLRYNVSAVKIYYATKETLVGSFLTQVKPFWEHFNPNLCRLGFNLIHFVVIKKVLKFWFVNVSGNADLIVVAGGGCVVGWLIGATTNGCLDAFWHLLADVSVFLLNAFDQAVKPWVSIFSTSIFRHRNEATLLASSYGRKMRSKKVKLLLASQYFAA
jgi:hypothetical protein